VNPPAVPSMLSNRLVRLFVDSATQEVGPDKLPTILAEHYISPSVIEKDHLSRLEGANAARLYASLQQALRLFYGRGARAILLGIWAGIWNRMMAQANFLEKAELEIVRRLPVPPVGGACWTWWLILCSRMVARPRCIPLTWICCWSTVLPPLRLTRPPLNRFVL